MANRILILPRSINSTPTQHSTKLPGISPHHTQLLNPFDIPTAIKLNINPNLKKLSKHLKCPNSTLKSRGKKKGKIYDTFYAFLLFSCCYFHRFSVYKLCVCLNLRIVSFVRRSAFVLVFGKIRGKKRRKNCG
jgi:hypothetical protein